MTDTTTAAAHTTENIPLRDLNRDTTSLYTTDSLQNCSLSSEAPADPGSSDAPTEHRSADPAMDSQPTTAPSSSPANNASEGWQLRINAAQLTITVLALLAVLAMLRPQLSDHRLNEDSFKLSRWTAWIYFRDECRIMMVIPPT